MKNKNVMKKMSCLFMAAAMTMSLAACGSAKTQETAGEAATEVAESAETVENTAETGKDASGKVFKVGICNYVDDASLNQIVENMESRLEEVIVTAKSLGLGLDECIEILKDIYEEV